MVTAHVKVVAAVLLEVCVCVRESSGVKSFPVKTSKVTVSDIASELSQEKESGAFTHWGGKLIRTSTGNADAV